MKLRILIAEDEEAARFGMKRALGERRYEFLEADSGERALELIRTEFPQLVFLDLSMPRTSGLEILEELRGSDLPGEIVVVTANDAVEMAVACMRCGASDYVVKPFEVERLRAIAERCAKRVSLEQRVKQLEGELESQSGFGALIGKSRPMRDLYGQIGRCAGAPVDVLLLGETGTGKELVARELHRSSGRAGPFLPVNTAAVAESLIESELFGHVRGAFTGADRARAGVFESAAGGTLFLDEIGDMPVPLQAKILRALQDRTVARVGSTTPVAVDVRVISATHQDLQRNIESGIFREDLYYRIRGVELRVPPLRERREDVMMLVDHFLACYRDSAGGEGYHVSPEAVDALLDYAWPGNVRELEQTVTAAAAMAAGDTLETADLNLPEQGTVSIPESFGELTKLPLTKAKARLVELFERKTIEQALQEEAGNVSAVARRLGLHRQSLQQKMTQLGITRGGKKE